MARYRGSQWEGHMYQLQEICDKQETELPDINTCIFKLKNLLSRKSKLFWNIKFFERYIEGGISPWGLRIQTFPTIKNVPPDFKKIWEANLDRCSRGMMEILTNYYQGVILEIDESIQKLCDDNKELMEKDEFISKEVTMNEQIEKMIKEVIKGKNKKFQRDRLAYKTERAYKWSNPVGRPNQRPKRPNQSQVPNPQTAHTETHDLDIQGTIPDIRPDEYDSTSYLSTQSSQSSYHQLRGMANADAHPNKKLKNTDIDTTPNIKQGTKRTFPQTGEPPFKPRKPRTKEPHRDTSQTLMGDFVERNIGHASTDDPPEKKIERRVEKHLEILEEPPITANPRGFLAVLPPPPLQGGAGARSTKDQDTPVVRPRTMKM